MSRPLRRAAVLVLAVIGSLSIPAAASAHPLGNFTINLYGGISVVPHEIRISYALDMAEIPTFQETQARIDANGDGVASAAEQGTWAREKAPELLAGLRLDVDGHPVKLILGSSSMVFRPGQGGLDVLRLEAVFSAPAPTSGSVRFEDTNYADHIGWREITAAGADGEAVRSSSVPVQSVSDELRAYPANLLQDPLKVTQATFSFAPGESNVVTPGTSDGSGARPGVIGGSFAKLIDRDGLSVAIVVLSLLLAVGFGALHAIAPGHGKTLMAAYLVGAGGRVRQAVAVGGAVSLMHTASVICLGLLVLYAESLFPRPEDVYPWLGLLSGAVAVVLGGVLFSGRFRARRRAASAGTAHDPAHVADGSEDRDHAHGDHDHAPGPHGHVHAAPEAPVLSRKGLAALAVAGGILPSPTALVVLLAAVSLHRLVFGLALILAFSIGLAAALIVVGVVALRARDLVSRRMTSRIGQVIPLLSACAIVAVGAFLVARAVTQL